MIGELQVNVVFVFDQYSNKNRVYEREFSFIYVVRYVLKYDPNLELP